jgi:hypothetical protein
MAIADKALEDIDAYYTCMSALSSILAKQPAINLRTTRAWGML